MAAAFGPETSEFRNDWESEQLHALRELRAEIQDLQEALDNIRNGEMSMKDSASYIVKTMNDIESLYRKIGNGDTKRHILNLVEQMQANPFLLNPEGEMLTQDQLRFLSLLDKQITKLHYYIALLAIPERVNDWLANARPGYYIPFHLVFEDEIPNYVDRVKILRFLAYSPETIVGGIVDLAGGVIFRYSDDPKDRRVNIAIAILALVLSAVLVFGSTFVPIDGWPLQSELAGKLLIAWLAVLAGIVTHAGVDSVKRTRLEGSLPPTIVVGDLPLIIDAKLGQILLRVLIALIGFYGFVFASGPNNATVLNAFLVGYTLDSFIQLLGNSIEQRAVPQKILS